MGEARGPGDERSPERFDRYMDRCLYDETSGFYSRVGHAGGRRGDFITSPEVGPLFGELVGRYLDRRWNQLGQPEEFVVIEAAAGRGALANTVLAAAPRCAGSLRYVTVERSERLRVEQFELLGDRVEICSSLDEVNGGQPVVGVVVANELLDNLGVRMAVRTVGAPDEDQPSESDWSEVFVHEGQPVLGPLDDRPTWWVRPDAPWGTRLPIHQQAREWVDSALAVLSAGSVVIVDYGVADTASLIGRDWIRTYRGHQRGGDPFDRPGHCDVTCDVAFDQLPAGAVLHTQAAFLSECGIDELVAAGRHIWTERAGIGDLAAMRARSRVNEAAALTDPAGLGGYLVAEWSVDRQRGSLN